MKHLIEVLLANGWKAYRQTYSKSTGKKYEPCSFINHYSSLTNGDMDYRFIKNGMEVIYGLNERDHPPTLVYPTDFVVQYFKNKGEVIYYPPSDKKVSQYLKEVEPEVVHEEIVKFYWENKTLLDTEYFQVIKNL